MARRVFRNHSVLGCTVFIVNANKGKELEIPYDVIAQYVYDNSPKTRALAKSIREELVIYAETGKFPRSDAVLIKRYGKAIFDAALRQLSDTEIKIRERAFQVKKLMETRKKADHGPAG